MLRNIIAPKEVPVAIFMGRPIKKRSDGTNRKPPPTPKRPPINPATAPIGMILYRSYFEVSVLCFEILDLKKRRIRDTVRTARYIILIIRLGI